ncbi:unnamed protein product [Scytosiphon promiscuus]
MHAQACRTLRHARPLGSSVSVRGMATEKQVMMRINATKNISKITQSMKMVSAAKLRGDQARLDKAQPFNAWTAQLNEPPMVTEDGIDTSAWPQNNLIVAISSDRGLCGGVNSFVTRAIKKMMISTKEQGKDTTLFVVGEKGRSQLSRIHADEMTAACTDAATPMQFGMATAMATEVLKHDFDTMHIVFNVFKSAIAYDTSIKTLPNIAKDGGEEQMVEYEFEPDTKEEVMQDMYEYLVASQMWHSLMESATSEQSSRMNAMENASKNAGEMIDSLTLIYNRARQSRITTELIEIISGASALEEAK